MLKWEGITFNHIFMKTFKDLHGRKSQVKWTNFQKVQEKKDLPYLLMLLWLIFLAWIAYLAWQHPSLRNFAEIHAQAHLESIQDVPVDNDLAKEWLEENVPDPIEFDPTPRTFESEVVEEKKETGDDRAKAILDQYGLGYTFDYWKEQGDKHGIVYSLPLCIGVAESGLGRNLTTPNNIGNVGNNDRGDRKGATDIYQGIRMIFQTIDGTWLGDYSRIGELSGQGRAGLGLPGCSEKGIFCYASDTKHWNDNVSKCMTKIWGREIGASFNYKY